MAGTRTKSKPLTDEPLHELTDEQVHAALAAVDDAHPVVEEETGQLLVPGADTTPAGDVAPRRSRSGTRRRSSSTRSRKSGDKAPRGSTTRKRAPSLAKRIEGVYLMAGIGAQMAPGLPVPVKAGAAQLATDSEKLGKAWEAYAATNPQVREWVEKLLTVSELGALVSLHAKALIVAGEAAGKLPAGIGAAIGAAGSPAADTDAGDAAAYGLTPTEATAEAA